MNPSKDFEQINFNPCTKLLFFTSRKKNWQKREWHYNLCKESYKIQNNKTPFRF